jgi:hypothetical protein
VNLTPDYVAWAGIGAIASAVTSIIAAVAAWRSAGSASAAIELAKQDRRAALRREASRVTNRVLALAAHIEELAGKVEVAYVSLFALSGSDVGGSLLQVHKARIQEKRDEASIILAKAQKSSLYPIDQRTDDELAEVVLTMDGHLARLDKIEVGLSTDLDLVVREADTFRESKLNKGFGVAPR